MGEWETHIGQYSECGHNGVVNTHIQGGLLIIAGTQHTNSECEALHLSHSESKTDIKQKCEQSDILSQ